jgi:CRP/FNR family transcriptional regulator, cyclic AMP receptor protein
MKIPTRQFDPRAFLTKVGKGRSIITYGQHQAVFSTGEPADAVFYIQSGKIKVTVTSKQGKEAIVAILSADDFIGEGCLAGQQARSATAVAMTESVVVRVKKSALLGLIRRQPAFAEMFITHLLHRTIRAEADLLDQLFNSSEKRLARVLLLLSDFGKAEEASPIIENISQGTLAEMVGTTRSRISFFMNKFRNLGLIDYNGHIEVHSSLLNVVLTDYPHISDDSDEPEEPLN